MTLPTKKQEDYNQQNNTVNANAQTAQNKVNSQNSGAETLAGAPSLVRQNGNNKLNDLTQVQKMPSNLQSGPAPIQYPQPINTQNGNNNFNTQYPQIAFSVNSNGINAYSLPLNNQQSENNSAIMNIAGEMLTNSTSSLPDANAVLKYSAGLGSLTDDEIAAADMNGDGKITAADARIIMNMQQGASGNSVGANQYQEGGNVSDARNVYEQAQQAYNDINAARPGEYQSAYESGLSDLIDSILNREKFSYDYANDPSYQAYAKSYTENANKSLANAMAATTAATGGYGNSYAAGTAQAAYAQQMNALSDIIPELEQLAYARYMDETGELYNRYGLFADADANAYSRYRDTVSDWNNDRSFAYQGMRDARSDYANDRDFDYGKFIDERNFGYQQSRDAVSDAQWDKSFDYQQSRDAVSDSHWQQSFDEDRRNVETSIALELLQSGIMPTADMLTAMGMSQADAERIAQRYKELLNIKSGGSGGSSSSSSGGGGDDAPKQPVPDPDNDTVAIDADRFIAEHPGAKVNSMTVSYYLSDKRKNEGWTQQDCDDFKEMLKAWYEENDSYGSAYEIRTGG